jgi:hypothetical protein
VLEVVGVEVDDVCVEVELVDGVLDELFSLPVEDGVVHGVEDDEPAVVRVVDELGEGLQEADEPVVVVDGVQVEGVEVEHVCVVDVVPALGFAVGVELVFVAVDVELVVPALAQGLVPEVRAGPVHHLVMKVAVVLPAVCDPVIVTGGATMVGFELAAVFDELWVLAVPPLIVG